ncbi:MAG: hypothetical protein BHW12_07940 [Coprobacillus sp. 28_7]|nr:MAG: hypothetical protein BHW12_07940 [Coprobacillus sp. 28_7]
MFPIANEINEFLNSFNKYIKVAVMGCVVNGPGEAKDADLGIAGGKNCAVLFKKGKIVTKLSYEEIIPNLKAEIYFLIKGYEYKLVDGNIIFENENQILSDENGKKYLEIIKKRK